MCGDISTTLSHEKHPNSDSNNNANSNSACNSNVEMEDFLNKVKRDYTEVFDKKVMTTEVLTMEVV